MMLGAATAANTDSRLRRCVGGSGKLRRGSQGRRSRWAVDFLPAWDVGERSALCVGAGEIRRSSVDPEGKRIDIRTKAGIPLYARRYRLGRTRTRRTTS